MIASNNNKMAGMKKIEERIDAIQKRLDKYHQQYVDNLHSCITDPIKENQGKELTSIRSMFNDFFNQIQTRKEEIRKNNDRLDDVEQYGRSNCLTSMDAKISPKKGSI